MALQEPAVPVVEVGESGMKHTKPLYLHPPLERIWHGIHTLCILTLIVTGALIRFPELGICSDYSIPVIIHNHFGVLLVADYVFWIFYLFLSGRLVHYLPKERDVLWGIVNQAFYYGFDIFRGRPHPYSASENEKFNPLQKWAYIGVMFGMVPLLCITGLVLLLPDSFQGLIGKLGGLGPVSVAHAIFAFCAAAFLVSHIYLATTGSSVFDAFKSMITGWVNEETH